MIRILFLADTHLGYDLPFNPRVKRRRRGPDFFDNYHQALQSAMRGEVDLVVHGGDLFFRARVSERLIEMVMSPLVSIAEQGIPVYLVPGNHERSRIPLRLWGTHKDLNIFNVPKTFLYQHGDITLALSGFPFTRDIRDRFRDLVDMTGTRQINADIHLLCIHQAVEGAVVGVQNYTFRGGRDVVRGLDIPEGITAVLSGHIHRAQILTKDLQGQNLPAPVVFPGSIERTSFVERDEAKGFMILELDRVNSDQLVESGIKIIKLPTRPMVNLEIDVNGVGGERVLDLVRQQLAELDPDSVVRIKVVGAITAQVESALKAAELRRISPQTMNVALARNRYTAM